MDERTRRDTLLNKSVPTSTPTGLQTGTSYADTGRGPCGTSIRREFKGQEFDELTRLSHSKVLCLSGRNPYTVSTRFVLGLLQRPSGSDPQVSVPHLGNRESLLTLPS